MPASDDVHVVVDVQGKASSPSAARQLRGRRGNARGGITTVYVDERRRHERRFGSVENVTTAVTAKAVALRQHERINLKGGFEVNVKIANFLASVFVLSWHAIHVVFLPPRSR